MFETLEVKDPREARERYVALITKERAKLEKVEREHAMSASRKEVRIEELRSELKAAKEELEAAVSREAYEKERKSHKANVAKWEKVFKEREDVWRQSSAKVVGFYLHLESAYCTDNVRRPNQSTATSISRLRPASTRRSTWRCTRSTCAPPVWCQH
jgi:translation initiation factor IF-2